MKRFIVFIAFSWPFFSAPQARVFLEKAIVTLKAMDSTYSIGIAGVSTGEYDFFDKGGEELELIFLSELRKIAREHPEPLMISHSLSTLAKLATESWKGEQYSDLKKWGKLSKYFSRAARRSTSPFNLMKTVSFRITLVNNHGRKFYYDGNGEEGQLNLYLGRKKSFKAKDEEEEPERTPLIFFTGEELLTAFERKIHRDAVWSDLKHGVYSYVGLSVEIDENTLNRKKLPTARIVVLLGARRLQKLRVSDQ